MFWADVHPIAAKVRETDSQAVAAQEHARPVEKAFHLDSPRNLPLVPIVDTVLFPGLFVPLSLARARSIAAVEAADLSADKLLLVLAQRTPHVQEPDLNELYPVGVLARLEKIARSNDHVEVQLRTLERIRVEILHGQGPYLEATFEPLPELTGDDSDEFEALLRVVVEQGKLNRILVDRTPYPGKLYFLGLELHLPLAKQQMLLLANSALEGLQVIHEHMAREARIQEIHKRYQSEAQKQIDRLQHDQLLRQELEHIQQELGDEVQGDLTPLKERLEKASLPATAREEAQRQLRQLEHMAPASGEYSLGRNYLELLVELPWAEHTQDRLDLSAARRILDEDHYGLQPVKERILEFLAVMQLNPTAHAPILCLVGPPGTGKTSLGKSIARALGRKFERLSLGGMHDEAELRGHRRTYLGAMSGRLIQAIRRSKVNNPLVMLDEVDKLRQSFEGDPAAALLEVLDPAQNHEFHDNYLDVPFDLSQVFFITTANTLETIPSPLLDRMEVIRLSGYTPEEKLHIAEQHLVPRLLRESGMTRPALQVPAATLNALISGYTSEAGVRQLERAIARLIRRLALRLAEQGVEPGTVEPADLIGLLGGDEVPHTLTREKLNVGVATGLAYTERGGELFYAEVSRLPGGEPLQLTGSLGEVLKESARAARSFLLSHGDWLGLPEGADVPALHVHLPAGATPKDGPSAGLAVLCAMLSALIGKPARAEVAMTGEITLCGLILPVGGIKEKVLAAHRAGLRQLILPAANARHLEELPASLRAEMQFFLVEQVEQALPHAFSDWVPPA